MIIGIVSFEKSPRHLPSKGNENNRCKFALAISVISVPVSPSTIITLYTVPNAKYVLSLEAVGIEAWPYIPSSSSSRSPFEKKIIIIIKRDEETRRGKQIEYLNWAWRVTRVRSSNFTSKICD